LEFLKHSFADLITLFFSSLQNSEGGGDSHSGDSFNDFLPKFVNNGESWRFFGRC
jgi:hypothetical protein